MSANAQGKFWPMYDRMFSNSKSLSQAHILEWANGLGLDTSRLASDLTSHKYAPAVAKDVAEGDKIGVDATPSVFINGQLYNGSLDFQDVKPILDKELKGK